MSVAGLRRFLHRIGFVSKDSSGKILAAMPSLLVELCRARSARFPFDLVLWSGLKSAVVVLLAVSGTVVGHL